jgi:hypothetical protein
MTKSAAQIQSVPLKIHIGLASGELSHVHVGESTRADGGIPRSEYFLAGPAVELAGRLLEIGKEGDLAISERCWRLAERVCERPSISPLSHRQDGIDVIRDGVGHWINDAFVVRDKGIAVEECARLLSGYLQFIEARMIKSAESEIVAGISPSMSQKALSYLDESLAHYLNKTHLNKCISIPSSMFDIRISIDYMTSGSLPTFGDSLPISQLSSRLMLSQNTGTFAIDSTMDYNQVRKVTAMFVRLSSFPVALGGQPKYLDIAQKVMISILEIIRKFNGCMRQFNCDEKAATILLVWGLDGFAHERGEPPYAIAASIEIATKLRTIVGDRFSIGIATGAV